MSQKTSFPRRLTGLRLLLIFSILAAGILVTGYSSYKQFEQNNRLEIERQLAAISELKVTQLVQWREEKIRDGDFLFKNRAFSALMSFVLDNPKDVEARHHLTSWLDKYNNHNYKYIRLLDCQGNDVISFPPNLPPLSEYNRRQILPALNDGRVFLQDFYLRYLSDTTAYLLLGVPIFDEMNINRPLGLAYLRISPETSLLPLIQRWPIPSISGETVLIRQDEDSVVYLNDLRFAKNSTLRLRLPIDRIDAPAVKVVLGASGIIEGVDYRGVPVISYAQAVPDSPWFIISKIDKAEVYAPIHERLWLMIAAALSLLLAAGSVIGYLYRQQSEDFYRKQYSAVQALKESEARYRKLFDASPVGIVHIGPDGKIKRANLAQCRMYRYESPEDMVGLHATLCVAPSSREYSSEIMSRRLKGEDAGQVEYRLIRKDGEEFWGEVSAEILREADGSVSGYICITRETTERKLAEAELERYRRHLEDVVAERTKELETAKIELAESIVRYDNLVDYSRSIILEWDSDGNVLFLNHWGLEFFGFTKEELIGHNVVGTIVAPVDESGQNLTDKMKDVQQKPDEYYSSENENTKKNGDRVWISWTNKGILDADGNVVKTLSVGIDRTLQHQIETELAKYRSHLEDVITERTRELEEKNQYLHRVSDRLSVATRAMKIGIWDWNVQKNELFWDNAMYELYSVKREDFEGAYEAWARHIHPDDKSRTEGEIQAALRGEREYAPEFRIVRPDGTVRHIKADSLTLRDEDGKVLKMVGTNMDITERKLSEEALKRANASLDAVIDNIPIMVFLKDPNELRFVRFNRAGEELLGSSRDDLIGKNDYDFFSKEQADFFTKKDRQVLREKRLVDIPEELIQTRNLGERVLHTRKVPVLKENGEPEYLLGVSEDITERKRSEKALQLSEARFKHIIESSNDIIYVLQDLKFKMLNRKFEEVTGWTREEAMAPEFDVMSIYTPESRETITERLSKRERGEAVPDRYTFKFQNKKGEIRELEANVSVITWDGRPAVMGFCRDITEQKLLEAQLFQAQKMESVGRLAGGVAHDFNNMLQVILTNTQFSLDDQSLDSSIRERLTDIQSAARHSADLTRQLLAFARKQTVTPVSLDLGEAVFKLLKILKQMIGEDIELSLVQGSHVGRINIDPVQVNQILANLCVNARDAISDTGKITIEVGPAELDEKYCSDHPGAKPGSYAQLKVSDNGCGMSREVVERMFDPFFTTKAIGKGTGLGLPMVYGIVKQNNGYISVESEIDRGTTFTLYFPLCDDAEDEDESNTERNLPRGNGQVVLLVEDDKTVLHIAKTSLEKLGYVVITAASADEALQLVKEHSGKIHLLLTDVIMPAMNGRELADQIKLFIPDIHCIFMSGYTADVIAHRGVLSQSINFLQKPFTFSDLAMKVSEVIGRSSR